MTARFEEFVEIPDADKGLIWAKFHLKAKSGGRLLAAVYKPPILGILVRARQPAADGQPAPYRFLPSLAAEGFLLSPLVKDRASFARLASTSWQTELTPDFVDAIKIVIGEGSFETYFEPEFTIELERLEFERQNRPVTNMR